MTDEERLAEIRARVEVNACPGCTCLEVRELLELVDTINATRQSALDNYEASLDAWELWNAELQEQVRGLEAKLATSIQVVHSGKAPFRMSGPLEVEIDSDD